MDPLKPNQEQFAAAERMIQQYGKAHGGTGTEQHQRRVALAVFAVLTARFGGVPDEYRACIGDADRVQRSADPEEVIATGINVPVAEYDRTKRILEGIHVDVAQHTIMVDEDAAILLRDPTDATPFPEVGLYIPYTAAARMVEQVMNDAANPDTIVGKEVRANIAQAEQAAVLSAKVPASEAASNKPQVKAAKNK